MDVRSNTIIGTASANGILLTNFDPDKPTEQHSTDNSIAKNDLKGLVAGQAQAFLDEDCGSNTSIRNEFGLVDSSLPGAAGIVIHSTDNHIAKETFFGDYLGVSGSPAIPWVRLATGSTGNTVEGIKRACGFSSFDIPAQIKDEGTNNIIGVKKPVPV